MPIATLTKKVQRGRESWTFIYAALALVLTLETVAIQLIEPLNWIWKLALFGGLSAATLAAFLRGGWVQNKLIGLKIGIEQAWR